MKIFKVVALLNKKHKQHALKGCLLTSDSVAFQGGNEPPRRYHHYFIFVNR